jgi:hypothetical protein
MIIRDQKDIKAASSADLVETYNALAGKSIKKFETRGIAEVRVANAILSAQYAAGKAGVPKDSKPKAATKKELSKKAVLKVTVAQTGEIKVGQKISSNNKKLNGAVVIATSTKSTSKNAPKNSEKVAILPAKKVAEFTKEKGCKEEKNPYKPGSMSHQLWCACKASSETKREVKQTRKRTSSGAKLTHVTLTRNGKTKMQPGSIRTQIMNWITSQPGDFSKRPIAISDIDKFLGSSSRGHIQKMIEAQHLVAFSSAVAA